jgi:hypothetical protein
MEMTSPETNLLDGYRGVQPRLHNARIVKNGALWNLHSTKEAAPAWKV